MDPRPAEPTATQLKYAPPATARRAPTYVVIAGLLTTALTLLGLHFLQEHVETDVMSFTVKYVIPLGALGVGFVAGLGYAMAAYFMNVRVHGWLIWTIVLFQVWAYFAAHFIEFKAQGPLVHPDTGAPVSFVEYYHYNTTHMVWIKNPTGARSSGGSREELGTTGYFYRGLG